MSNLTKFFDGSNSFEEYANKYFNYLGVLLESISKTELANFLKIIEEARDEGRTVIFMGNGGSAATASHFANDLSVGTRSYQKPYKSIALTDNVSVITAIANDDSYDCIFEFQLRNIMKPGDVVVAISASGNSKNVLQAVNWANGHKGITIGITGFDGGQLKSVAKYTLHVPSNKGEYGPVEDVHMIIDHLLSSYLIEKLKYNQEYNCRIK